MDRRILLISNPGEIGAENYCNGVNVDIQKYKEFFTSALGGAWKSSEITHLEKPTKTAVKSEVSKLSSTDYSMVIFCGHGYVSSSTKTTQLCLRPHEHIDEIDLREKATRRSIILDCCREVHAEPVFEAALTKAMKMDHFKKTSLEESRTYFDKELSKTSNGIIVIHACSVGETAGDSSSEGGYYSESLRVAVKNWALGNDVDLAKSYSHMSLVKAHNDAIPALNRRSGGTQNPQIEKPRSEPYFPFAILA